VTFKTGQRSPSQNAHGWRDTGKHGDNWCHHLWSPIFSHEDDGIGKARQDKSQVISEVTNRHQTVTLRVSLETVFGVGF